MSHPALPFGATAASQWLPAARGWELCRVTPRVPPPCWVPHVRGMGTATRGLSPHMGTDMASCPQRAPKTISGVCPAGCSCRAASPKHALGGGSRPIAPRRGGTAGPKGSAQGAQHHGWSCEEGVREVPVAGQGRGVRAHLRAGSAQHHAAPPSRHRCRCAHHFKAAFICLALYFRRRELERALERALVRSSLSWEHLTQESGRGPAVGRGGRHTRAPRGCWVPVLRLCPSSPVVFWGPPVPRGHPGGGMLHAWGSYAVQGVCGGVTSHPQRGCGDGESGDCTSPAGDGPVPAASTHSTASPCGLGATGGVSHPHPQPFPPPMEISLGCRAPAARAVRVLAV